ncbi:MAG: translation initiation factor IF-6 [Candidatus Micrarchaeota archaeon]
MYHVKKLDINRNPFIGLYLSASDKALLSSPFIPESALQLAKETLFPAKICAVTIGSSHLTGLFTVMNSNGCIVPKFAEDKEVQKITKELELNVCKVPDEFSAIRNNFLVNDRACVVNESLPKIEQKKVSDCLDVEVFPMRTGGLPTVGSLNVVTNKGLIGFNDLEEDEFNSMLKIFHVKGTTGTCNFGTVSISLGIVANSTGALAGSFSTGFELGTTYQALSGEE